MKATKSVLMMIIALLTLTLPIAAYSFPIAAAGTEGLSVIVTSTDHVLATYQGNSAQYSNDLYLNGEFIFNNHSTSIGTVVDLGSFEIGTELVFQLHVNDTGNDFYTGAAARNPDGHTHARVQEEWEPNVTLVSFEDLFNGAFEYNDLSFSFTNTSTTNPVPIPGAVWLFGSGLAGLIGLNRRYFG